MPSVISYLKARACERSTRLAGLAFLAIAGYAAWQWRCDLWHVIAGGSAAAIAAIPEYAITAAARYLSAMPAENDAPPPTDRAEFPSGLHIFVMQAKAAELRAAQIPSPAPPAEANPQGLKPMSIFEKATEAVIADLGPDFCAKLVQKLEDQASSISPEAAALMPYVRAAFEENTLMGWVKLAARVFDDYEGRAMIATMANTAPVPQPAAP